MVSKDMKYEESQIQVLEGLEAVRKRPGMYIGTTGSDGLHHLIYEIVDNSVDEALSGYCSEIFIEIGEDETGEYAIVQDNGRGIPIEKHPQKKIPTVRVVMEILHAGGKFGGGGYKVSGGLHGVGISVVNALSKKMEVYVVKDKKKYGVLYENGGHFKEDYFKTAPKGNITGTYVKFYPDEEIFEEVNFDFEKIKRRLRQTAFLTPQVKLHLKDTRKDREEDIILHYENGLIDYIKYITQADKALVKNGIFFASGESNDILVEVGLTYTGTYSEKLYCFANNIYNPEGGTHLIGFRRALTRVLNDFAKTNNIFKKADENLSGDDVRDGLAAVISVKLGDPQFEGQTKSKLGNPPVQGAVESVVYEQLKKQFEDNPNVVKIFIQKCLDTQRARLAAKKAKELVRQKNNSLDNVLIGKLADCSSKNVEERELFIVEGDSAGGSAKQGRNRHFQAILPLKGKIINIEKTTDTKAYSNDEVKALITAIGTGVDKDFSIEGLNYNKIIILSDADVDGSHIRTLLLTFFIRKLEKLVVDGHIWVAQPPLYQLKSGKSSEYIFSQSDLKKKVAKLRDGSYNVSRFKGLGEMNPEQLWETTMNPATRQLKQVYIEDFEEVNTVIQDLMGNKVDNRKKFIERRSKEILLKETEDTLKYIKKK